LPEIQNTEIVYLFLNEYSIFFRDTNIPIIGSGHTLDIHHFLDDHTIFLRLSSRIIHFMYFKNINGFNYFPKDSRIFVQLKDKWNLKYNFPLPPGVDTELFHPDPYVAGVKLKVLFVAALEYSKGLDLLIPVMDKFSDNQNIEFHIAGTGPVEDEILQRKFINYHKGLNNAELANLYRHCDIFIYPSHSDYYPAVVSQAFSSGLYVLVGDFFKGIFDDFGEYLEYIPMNVESFYNRINDIINNRKIIDHDRQEEYEYVRSNYDWSIIAKKFYDNMENIYNEFYYNQNGNGNLKD
jgi:glycosyltransferase involved in cell wall biosynthesis